MPYELSPQETLGEGVRRCAREQLDRAVAALRDEVEQDPVGAVHTARKAVKKERALLRLASAALPSRQRAMENVQLRDIGRTLSGVRDSDVMVQTVEQLAERFRGQLPEATTRAVRDQLLESRDARRAHASEAAVADGAIGQLMEARLRIDGWELRADGWKAVGTGLRRTYRRGRKALRLARSEPSIEHLHEWRKRVKDHWYHLRLLTRVCGPIVGGAAEEADRLSELLGEDHDLGVLRELVVERSWQLPTDAGAMVTLLDQRREQLRAEALQVGLRLYAERPAAFERRLRRCWKAGRMVDRLDPEDLLKN